MRILILCTGNSCRSQMAEGILKSLKPAYEVYSAGTKPETEVNPNAVQVMREIGIDISGNHPKSVSKFLDMEFDFVITVCDNARESCPAFTGKVKHRIHTAFADPANAKGNPEDVLQVYRQTRDDIYNKMKELFINK